MSVAVGADSRICIMGNPTDPSGPLYDASQSPAWKTVTLSALDHANYIERREVVPGAMTYEAAERIRVHYGEESPIYKARVLAEWPEQSENSLVLRSWLEESAERWEAGEPDYNTPPRIGLDPAWLGEDRTAVVVKRGRRVTEIKLLRKTDIDETVGQVVTLCRSEGLKPGRGSIVCDSNGLGVGVASGLKSQGFSVMYFRASMKAPGKWYKDHENLRAASYMNVRELLRKGKLDIPRDTELWTELLETRFEQVASGRIKIEGKDRLRSRLGKSPDKADALVYACWTTTGATLGGQLVTL